MGKVIRGIYGFCLGLLAQGTLLAQEQPLSPCDEPCGGTRPPTIWIDPALGKLEPITLASVDIQIQMQGSIASTTLDLSFHNPNDRVLEGELVLPLASGQTISGYALEVNGQLRQGVAVPKETARVAFEEITRRGIDPGLAELTQGNVFRTRLYPIPARGHKRVVLSFDQPLLDAGKNWRYVLPMRFEQPIGSFKVRAEAVRSEHAPVAEGNAGALGFKRWQDSFVAELAETDFKPAAELAFSVPKTNGDSSVFRVPDRLEPAWTTFAAQLDTGLPTELKLTPARNIALIVDASGSAAKRDLERELRFLESWFKQLGKVDVQLYALRNELEAAGKFKAGSDNAGLFAAIRSLPIDGGSSYGAIALSRFAVADTVVIIGDGLSNFGSHEPDFSSSGAQPQRVVLLHAAQAHDPKRLQAWSRRSGGQLLNLLELTPEEALQRLQQPRWQLLSTRQRSGLCTEMAPSAPQSVDAQLNFHGRCKGPAELELVFGNGDGANVVRSLKLDGEVLDPQRGAFVQRLWAAARIYDLEAVEGPESAAALELAKAHGIVTARTSLLVLDAIEDYVRYGIEPREPELAALYRQQRGALPKIAAPSLDQSHLDSVLQQWRMFRDWHARRHPWLETVLAGSAQAELARWQGLQGDPRLAPLARQHLKELTALANQATQLEQSWLKEGAAETSRLHWERRAADTMLRLDTLRQLRLKAWPESESAALDTGTRARDAMNGGSAPEGVMAEDAGVELDMAEPAASPSLAAAPPAARPVASADGEMESIAITGARVAPGGPADDAERKEMVGGKNGEGVPLATQASIELAPWNPDTPYLAKLRAAADPYAAYLRERESQASTPAFFLDCADFFRSEVKDAKLALRILSNLAEIDFESAPLLRILAYRLGHWERFDLAVPLFEEALRLRGEEPQSRRDLGLALSRQAKPDYPRAITLLWEVVSRPWDGRFPEIEVIALHELNDMLARMPQAARAQLDLARIGIPEAFVEAVPVDLRVVLSWDADNTDIDLWVIDPIGEIAIYSNPQTRTGGQVSRDFTGGYGPEVYTIKRALPGTYVVKAHYYGDRQQKLTGAVTVQLEFLTRFNSAQSSRQAVTRRLEGDEDQIEIGRFRVEAQ